MEVVRTIRSVGFMSPFIRSECLGLRSAVRRTINYFVERKIMSYSLSILDGIERLQMLTDHQNMRGPEVRPLKHVILLRAKRALARSIINLQRYGLLA